MNLSTPADLNTLKYLNNALMDKLGKMSNSTVDTETLGNGAITVVQNIGSMGGFSPTLIVLVPMGAMNETPEQLGLAHVVEHFVFKGMKEFSARELLLNAENMSIEMNAATSKWFTMFYGTFPEAVFEKAVNFMADLVYNPSFPERELEKELKVVISELNSSFADMGMLISLLFERIQFGNAPLGRSVGACPSNIEKLTKQDITEFYKKYYKPENMIISVSGNLPENATSIVKNAFKTDVRSDSKMLSMLNPFIPEYTSDERYIWVKRPLDQSGLMYGVRSVPPNHELRFSFDIAAKILGSGLSSILFTVLREENGLVYSAQATTDLMPKCGFFIIKTMCNPNDTFKVLNKIKECIKMLYDVKESDIIKAKNSILSKILSMSTASGPMAKRNMEEYMISNGKIPSLYETAEKIGSVNKESIRKVAEHLLKSSTIWVGVGNPGELENKLPLEYLLNPKDVFCNKNLNLVRSVQNDQIDLSSIIRLISLDMNNPLVVNEGVEEEENHPTEFLF